MKRLVCLLAMIAVVMAAPAMAQDPVTDTFGLYFDDGPVYTLNCLDSVAPGTPVQCHMVIAGPTAVGAVGLELEFALYPVGTGVFVGTSFSDAGIDANDLDDRPEGVMAEFAAPALPNPEGFLWCGDLDLIMLIQFEVLAGPNTTDTEVDFPFYVDPEDDSNHIPLNWATSLDGMGVGPDGFLLPGFGLCGVDYPCPFEAEDEAWSSVKGMFR